MKRSSNERPMRSAFDALTHMTAEITRFLEHGVMLWRAPWDPNLALAPTPGLPLRSTGQRYRGANVVLLWAAQICARLFQAHLAHLSSGASDRRPVHKGEKACGERPATTPSWAKRPDDHESALAALDMLGDRVRDSLKGRSNDA